MKMDEEVWGTVEMGGKVVVQEGEEYCRGHKRGRTTRRRQMLLWRRRGRHRRRHGMKRRCRKLLKQKP